MLAPSHRLRAPRPRAAPCAPSRLPRCFESYEARPITAIEYELGAPSWKRVVRVMEQLKMHKRTVTTKSSDINWDLVPEGWKVALKERGSDLRGGGWVGG